MDMSKPRVKCQLISLEQVCNTPVMYRAVLQRVTGHPRLGRERPGQTTVTSRILRIDFEYGVIETLNTYYLFKEV